MTTIGREFKLRRTAEMVSGIKARKLVKRKSNESPREWLSRLGRTHAKILEQEYVKRGFNRFGN